MAIELSLFIGIASSFFLSSFGETAIYKQDCPSELQKPWSYDYNLPNGVKYWDRMYPQCRGRSQSPINILSRKVKKDLFLPKLQLYNYDKPVTRATISNNGYTVKIEVTDGIQRSILVNGDRYSLSEIHFHWGERKNKGSEHTVDFIQYSMEVHFVHKNGKGDIAVVGVFYAEGHKDNLAITPLTNVLSRIPYKDDFINIIDEIYLDDITDNMCSFYRYNGSLTTPPCTENVIWTVCREVHNIGHNQMIEFRKLYSERYSDVDLSNCKISNNYRPVQPLNGRTVYSSAYFGSF